MRGEKKVEYYKFLFLIQVFDKFDKNFIYFYMKYKIFSKNLKRLNNSYANFQNNILKIFQF